MATQITITIGRNLPLAGKPMSQRGWERFGMEVEDALSVATTHVETLHSAVYRGVSEWQGIKEDSAIITTVTTAYPAFTMLDWLRDRLEHLRATYGQDAIALAIGESELIERG